MDEASARLSTREVMTSVPASVVNVKVSTVVVAPPGAMVEEDGSLPVVRLVEIGGAVGVAGDPTGISPFE